MFLIKTEDEKMNRSILSEENNIDIPEINKEEDHEVSKDFNFSSKDFTKIEMTTSSYAVKYNIKEQFDPPLEIKKSLKKLLDEFLQPVRNKFGDKIKINSAYRCPKVNEGIGGAKNSWHTKGQAVDIIPVNFHKGKELFYLIKDHFDFDTLIWYHEGDDEPVWIHVTYRTDAPNTRKRIMYKVRNGGYSTWYDPK